MRETLTAYRDATLTIIDLLSVEGQMVDTDRLDELLALRESLIARHPSIPHLRENAELLAVAEEIVRLDAYARDLLARDMQQTQHNIQQMKNSTRRMAVYEQTYQPDAFFIDKKK
jgi:hypothetical protein